MSDLPKVETPKAVYREMAEAYKKYRDIQKAVQPKSGPKPKKAVEVKMRADMKTLRFRLSELALKHFWLIEEGVLS